MIYATQGMRRADAGGSAGGDGRACARTPLQLGQGTPDSSTPVVCGSLLYFVTNDGVVDVLTPKTGRLRWKEPCGANTGRRRWRPTDASISLFPTD